jgi:hypothetical protein
MKFLSLEKFKELKVLFILEFLMALLLFMLISVNDFSVNYWDWKAFSMTIGIWLLSSIVDKEKYWNLGTFIGTGLFMYMLWWFIFNIQIS